jgi:hypothetical protein
MLFSDGGKFVWRNGDTTDVATGLKCTLESGGIPVGSPGTASVQTLAFVYLW